LRNGRSRIGGGEERCKINPATRKHIFIVYFGVTNTLMASLPLLWWGTVSVPITFALILAMVAGQYVLRAIMDPDRGAPSSSALTLRRFLWMTAWFGSFVVYYALSAYFLALHVPVSSSTS